MSTGQARPPLDPDAARFLEKLKAAGIPPIDQIPLKDLRAGSAATVVTLDPIGRIEDRAIDGPGGRLPIRIYRPESAGIGQALPALVFFHGGGWVLGSLDSHDGLCRRLCRLTEWAVVSVDYRLAPEHPFPAAVEDAEAAVRWVARHAAEAGIDPSRLAVCGDSAGANLATAAARRVMRDVPLVAQVLWYPATGFDMETESYRENQVGYFLTRVEMRWFTAQYLRSPEDRTHPDAVPIRAESLAGMPATYLLTAGYDPLRDDGRAFAQKLIESGVTVHFTERAGLIHGFMRRLDDFRAATEVLREVAAFLKARIDG